MIRFSYHFSYSTENLSGTLGSLCFSVLGNVVRVVGSSAVVKDYIQSQAGVVQYARSAR